MELGRLPEAIVARLRGWSFDAESMEVKEPRQVFRGQRRRLLARIRVKHAAFDEVQVVEQVG